MPYNKNFQYFCATFPDMRFRTIIYCSLVLLAVSCSEYENFLKAPDYDLKFTKLMEYYDQGKYAKTSELINQVIPVYRATEES